MILLLGPVIDPAWYAFLVYLPHSISVRCPLVSTFLPFDQDLSPEASLSKSQVFIIPWPLFPRGPWRWGYGTDGKPTEVIPFK